MPPTPGPDYSRHSVSWCRRGSGDRVEDAGIRGVPATFHRAGRLQLLEHLVHGLRGHERPPGEVGIRQAWRFGQEGEDDILRDAEAVRRDDLLESDVDGGLSSFDEVAGRLSVLGSGSSMAPIAFLYLSGDLI